MFRKTFENIANNGLKSCTKLERIIFSQLLDFFVQRKEGRSSNWTGQGLSAPYVSNAANRIDLPYGILIYSRTLFLNLQNNFEEMQTLAQGNAYTTTFIGVSDIQNVPEHVQHIINIAGIHGFAAVFSRKLEKNVPQPHTRFHFQTDSEIRWRW